MVTVLGVWEFVVTGKMGLTLGSASWGTGHGIRNSHLEPRVVLSVKRSKRFILEGSGYVIYAPSTVVG